MKKKYPSRNTRSYIWKMSGGSYVRGLWVAYQDAVETGSSEGLLMHDAQGQPYLKPNVLMDEIKYLKSQEIEMM